MDITIVISLAAILVLLVLSAFFSGSETSLTAASRLRMHNLEQSGEGRGKLVNELLAHKERLIGAILLGNNLVNIMASALATSILIGFFGEAGVVYATISMTLLVLIFAEVLPKTYAFHNADRLALKVAPILKPVVVLLAPVTQGIQLIVRGTLRLFGIKLGATLAPDAAEEELRGAIDLHTGESDEEDHEREMLRSILDLAEVWVEEIMIHRQDVSAINIELPPETIVDEVLASPYTRFPLWREKPDNIVGVLHAKALLRAMRSAGEDPARIDVEEVAGDPWFIPETTDLLSQLQAFRSRHEHFAIVVDEYGEFLGVVTLEDILEEIVGDIADEHDVEIEGVQVEDGGGVVIDGRVTIRDLNRRFGWRLPSGEAATIAGLVLYEARAIPREGQVFAFHGFSFEILQRKRNQLTLIRLTPLGQGAPKEDAGAAVTPE
jgi:Mg2+/Co2+ transporter CorB